MRRRNGFSLAELLVSLLILSTLTVVMAGVMPTTVFGMHQASERANAATLADQALAQMRQTGLSAIRNVTYPAQTVNRIDYLVQVEYDVAKTSDGSLLDPKLALDVSVTVRWVGSRGGSKTYATRSMVGRYR